MHDPKSVAHEIYLGKKKKKNGHYRSAFITIWHNDPEKDGTDDSCGWNFSKITKEEHEYLDKVAKDQYYQMFSKDVATAKNESYAYICYNQDVYGVIYWMWRHFNIKINKAVWQYGKPLSNNEMQYVYQLATNPVDNFQHSVCKNQQEFRGMLTLIYRCWKSYHRKWYQHPKWHIHHWSIQFHPFQNLKRRYWDKCSICGKRGFKGAAYGSWRGDAIWHPECDKEIQVPIPEGK